MSAKSSLMAFTALAAMGIMHNTEKRIPVEPDTEGQKARREKAHIEVLMSKGMKWFDVDGVWILALNKKNAERKAKKLTA